tara:strand:+ start:29917 stop:31278 length:1362 start_codon:yes stop_codon:yes gene_type:complete
MILMRYKLAVLPLIAALALGACGKESSFPEASGKGNIRAINAIASAPEVTFLIEERSLGGISFREATAATPYDDLEYTFNFEVFYAGDDAVTRIASQFIDVVADMDYTLVLTGTLSNASVVLWEQAKREFTGTETVFSARFAHTSDSLGPADYYFAAPGVVPVLGEEVGTLSFGEVLDGIDYEAGDYVLTVTSSGDPADILFESDTNTFIAATEYTVSMFDGGANTFAPFIAHSFTNGAVTASGTIPDVNYPATAEFVNGSLELGTVDIYDDDMQTSLLVDDLPHMGISAELNLADGENQFTFTPSDSNNPVLIDDTLSVFSGVRTRVVGLGLTDSLRISTYVPDRRPVDTQAKLQVFSAANTFGFLQMFVLEADAVLDDQLPVLASLVAGSAPQTLALRAGSYDIYVREFDSTEILAGPIRLDVELGDVIGTILYDTVDPAVVEVQMLQNTP